MCASSFLSDKTALHLLKQQGTWPEESIFLCQMNLDRQGVCEYSWSPKSQHVLIFQLNELEDRNGEGLENDTPLQLWRVLYESGLVTQSKIFYVFFFPLNIFFIV